MRNMMSCVGGTSSSVMNPLISRSTISTVIAESGGPYTLGSSLLFRGHSYMKLCNFECADC